MRLALALILACCLARGSAMAADGSVKRTKEAEGLTVKIIKTFGPGGPVHGDEYRPGEGGYYRAIASGLTSNDAGKINVGIQFELLDANDKSIKSFGDTNSQHHSFLDAGRYAVTGFFSLPDDAAGKQYRLVVKITDCRTDQKAQASSTIVVSKQTAPAPMEAYFSSDRIGRNPLSGRFVEGDNVYLLFGIANPKLADGDRLTTSLTLLGTDGLPSVRQPLQFAVTSDAANANGGKPIAGHFAFNLDRPFKGYARLAVHVNDEKEGEYVDIPIEVLRAVGE